MTPRVPTPNNTWPIGYAHLIQRHRLRALPHHHWSFIACRGARRRLEGQNTVSEIFPAGFRDLSTLTDADHLLFSLRYDGVSLSILQALFASLERAPLERDLTALIAATPTGQYTRRLWYLYEHLTQRRLPLPDHKQGRYIPLLDPAAHFTGPSQRSKRHRVLVNLLGDRRFCPIVRRTPALEAVAPDALRVRIQTLLDTYDPDVLHRAVQYLYTRETRASFAIEHERPTASRMERFVALLGRVPAIEQMTQEVLTELQHTTVDPRFADTTYRTEQVYIGETLSPFRQKIHYVAPRAEDVTELMAGLLDMTTRNLASDVHPIALAAAVSFGFVFIHPFSDGNGRLHRLLIHYVLSQSGLTPPGMIVPISSVMLSRRREYDTALEDASRPLLALLEYDLSEDGTLSISGETIDLYRYLDFTTLAEALQRWLVQAIEEDLLDELLFISRYRRARAALEEIVEMPDQLLSRFVRFCLLNNGRLSNKKRKRHFAMLDDDEIARMESVISGLDHRPGQQPRR